MELVRDVFSLRRAFPDSALTIGNFDGVHVGHQRYLARAVEAARRAGGRAVVFTFDPHPEALLEPERAPDRILTFDHKLALMAAAGVDVVICPDGPLAVLALEPEAFVRRMVVEAVGAAVVVEGPNFHFGRGAAGDDSLLRRMADEGRFRLEIAPAVTLDGDEVSSTRIRRAVREGRVAQAARMLGRPFEFVGRVVHGRHRGHDLGYPTVNLAGGDFLVPGDGVYAGWTWIAPQAGAADHGAEEGPYAAAVSVGCAATFEPLPQPVVEACLLDFRGDLYGRTVRLAFVDFLRAQQTFDGAPALAEQMGRDCRAAGDLLAGRPPGELKGPANP